MRRTRLRQPGNRLFLVFRRKSPPRLLCHLVPPGRYSIYHLVRDPGAMSTTVYSGIRVPRYECSQDAHVSGSVLRLRIWDNIFDTDDRCRHHFVPMYRETKAETPTAAFIRMSTSVSNVPCVIAMRREVIIEIAASIVANSFPEFVAASSIRFSSSSAT